MTDPINESFSALLDNEASDMDIQRLLNAMDNQPEKMTDWKKIASGHSKCQGELSIDVLSGINESLYQQGEIEQIPVHQIAQCDEPAITNDGSVASVSWLSQSKKWLGSATIAASVCAATVLGINSFNDEPTGLIQKNGVLATGNPVQNPIGPESLMIQDQLKEHYQQHSSQTAFGVPINTSPATQSNTQETE